MNQEDIKQVGVVGGGTMGFGIAINFALWGGYPTIIQDLKESILDQSAKQIRSSLKLFIEEDLITPEQAKEAFDKITLTTDLRCRVDITIVCFDLNFSTHISFTWFSWKLSYFINKLIKPICTCFTTMLTKKYRF